MEDDCMLFGSFGWFVQGLLGFVCISSLLLKRTLEYPPRPWNVFWLDTTKQACSSALAHLMNLTIAYVLSGLERDDECVWYFINIVIDCSVGVFIAYVLHQLVATYAFQNCAMLRSGHYLDEYGTVNLSAWALQLVVWCLIVSLSKWLLVCIIALFRRAILCLPLWRRFLG
mmetsp:Transcript_34189/g.59813  ORF Transcript_34189/g.59813 Transcript_34189/m.59813 type:complete len:171 (+) Transcript_34189:1417-1929(+)